MNNTDFSFGIYNDRAKLTDLPEALRHAMRDKGLIPHGSVYVHFCGLIAYENKTAVFLPRNSKVTKESNKTELARNLLKAIQRYKLSADSAETADQGAEVIGSDSITLIVALLDDYILNGLYTRRDNEHSLNQGRTDWKKTINQMTPFPSRNSMFYPDVIGSRTLTDQNNDITRIHSWVIREICAKAGWIAFSEPSLIAHELEHVAPFQGSAEAQINSLNRELHITYSDRDIFLLKSILQYLKKESGQDNSDLIVGLRECHGLWEKMLDSCLLHKESVNHRMTAPLYKISGEYVLASSKGHRTDTVLKHPGENKFVIADAKYYGAHNIQDSPKLADIIKQFYYAKAMHIIEKGVENITNVFIFPGLSGKIESVHMAEKSIRPKYSAADCLDTDYPPIHCVYQDPIELLEHYSKGKPLRKLTSKLLALGSDK